MKLYLVPTPVGNLGDITFRAVEVLKSVNLILAEDTRTSRPLLQHYSITTPLQSYHIFNEHQSLASVIDRLQSGMDIALITDAGTPTPDMQRFVEQARHLVIEANYDEQMLQNGPYPAFLQRRIAGERGHMDNRDTAASLRQWLTPATRNIWLCHLSEENNHPDIARKTVQNAIDELDFAANVQLHVLPRRQATGIIHLN